jgi:hypothetical protein
MERRLWLWRLAFVVVGLVVYWLVYPSGLYRPLWLLYDASGLGVTCLFAGSIVGRVAQRASRPGDPVRGMALLAVVLVGFGVQYGGWPFSGHLVAATTAGVLENGDRRSRQWFRVGVCMPVIALLLIRLLWPQIPRMAVDAHTFSGLVLGAAIGALALLPIRQRERDG